MMLANESFEADCKFLLDFEKVVLYNTPFS